MKCRNKTLYIALITEPQKDDNKAEGCFVIKWQFFNFLTCVRHAHTDLICN